MQRGPAREEHISHLELPKDIPLLALKASYVIINTSILEIDRAITGMPCTVIIELPNTRIAAIGYQRDWGYGVKSRSELTSSAWPSC